MKRPPPMSSRRDPTRFAALRLATLARTPGFVGGERAPGQLAALWARAEHLGLVHLHRADAQVFWFRDPRTWFGGLATIALIDRDPTSAEALAAVLACVERAGADLDDTTYLEVDAHDLELVRGLVALGFHIDSIIQVGDPQVALGRLVARYDPPTTLAAHGLTLDAAGAGDLDGIVALHGKIFSARPELCFFGARPEHLVRMREGLARHLADRHRDAPPSHWVVRDGAQVVGHVEAEVDDDHPFWGRHAGMGVVLDDALQGRGIVKSLYRVALAAAVAHGARLIKGGTAQPAVMGLGHLMGRPWHSIGLRRQGTFEPEHFLRFHPSRVNSKVP